jgi:hypothetical protein
MIQPPFFIKEATTSEVVTVLESKESTLAVLESSSNSFGNPSVGLSGRRGSTLLGDISCLFKVDIKCVSANQTNGDDEGKNVVGTLTNRESEMRDRIYRVQKLSR